MKTIFFETIDNTQNYALENYDSEPLLVLSYSQSSGRGRERKESMYVCMYLCVRESRERVEKEKNLKIILTEVRDNRGLVN